MVKGHIDHLAAFRKEDADARYKYRPGFGFSFLRVN
jgi:hypothetical protein